MEAAHQRFGRRRLAVSLRRRTQIAVSFEPARKSEPVAAGSEQPQRDTDSDRARGRAMAENQSGRRPDVVRRGDWRKIPSLRDGDAWGPHDAGLPGMRSGGGLVARRQKDADRRYGIKKHRSS